MRGNLAFQHPVNMDCRINEDFIRDAPLHLSVA